MGLGRESQRLVHRLANCRNLVHRARILRHRSQQRWVVEFLECPRAPPESWRAAAEDEDGRAVEPGSGHRRDPVRHARPCSQYGKARSARELACRLSRKHRGLLMPYVDQAHRLRPFTAASYSGKTWAPDSVHIVATPCACAAATARLPPCPSMLVMGANLTRSVRAHTASTRVRAWKTAP